MKAKKQTISIGPVNVTKRPPKPKYKKTTPQDIATNLRKERERLEQIVTKHCYRRKDLDAGICDTYKMLLKFWREQVKELLDIDLPDLPDFDRDDYTTIRHYTDTYKNYEAKVRDKINDTEPNPELLMCFAELEMHFDKNKRTIRRLAHKYSLKEYPDSGNRNRIRIYKPDLDKLPEHDRLKTRDYASKQELLAKRKQKQAQKKRKTPTSLATN